MRFIFQKISYEWYLTHILIFTIIYYLVPSNDIITILLIAPIAFIISLIIAKLTEDQKRMNMNIKTFFVNHNYMKRIRLPA